MRSDRSRRRDMPSYETMDRLWAEIRRNHKHLTYWSRYGQTSERSGLDKLYVFSDGLREHGFSRLATEITSLAKNLEDLSDKQPSRLHVEMAIDIRNYVRKKWPSVEKRVHQALREIRDQPKIWIGQRRLGKERTAVVRYVHAISPSPSDVSGPFPVQESDLEDLASIRRWLEKHRSRIGHVREWRKEKGKIVIFPARYHHAIIIEPGRTRKMVRAREAQDVARFLKEKGFANPNLSARRLLREGFTPYEVKNQWMSLEGLYGLRRTTSRDLRRLQ